jgi:DNA (cytosine-5)-methyltransferase 1
MGWENVFHCEWNEFGQKILKHYWPNAISYGDITKTDFTIHRGNIDILTGGFPCQPYSMAGKRKGKEDDRHLWPEMLRTIREIQPCWVVGENVPGIINWSGGLVFHEVQTDLEAEGYEVFPVVLPACGVNAPHRRDRIWFIAHSIHPGDRTSGSGNNRKWEKEIIEREQSQPELSRYSKAFSDTGNQGLQRSKINGSTKRIREKRNKQSAGSFCTNWQVFPTQSPLCSRDDGVPSRLSGIAFSKHRNESIKAYGNSVVPQVVYQIFKAIENLSVK